jgi:hypothetical protein
MDKIPQAVKLAIGNAAPGVDVTQALKDAENALRDLIASILIRKFGDEWLQHCGRTAERIQNWHDRQNTERKKHDNSGAVEERLLYYADFYDLWPIMKTNWSLFSPVFESQKTVEVWLYELARLRDPDAHRRELLPHQKHLTLGISGEIRTRIVRYRSKMETSEDYYPRIESIRDNYGNVYTSASNYLMTKTRLKVGDLLQFTVTASDPQARPLEYAFLGSSFNGNAELYNWKNENILEFVVNTNHILKELNVIICIRNDLDWHALPFGCDDRVTFCYEVIPPRHVEKI